jgi:uncharacterized protein (DUF779 family)
MHDDGPAGQSRSKVSATAEALTMIERLSSKHGLLAFFQSGGCCDGSLPICLPDGALPAGPGDEMLGMVGGAPVYIDGDLWTRWGRPSFVLDVRPGAPEGFSLGLPDAHFVTVSPDPITGPPAQDVADR